MPPTPTLIEDAALEGGDLWQFAVQSHELSAAKPLGLELSGERVVLYRKTDGTVVAMEDRCSHRWALLSDGRVEGDNIVCPLHGVLFCPSGRAVCSDGVRTVPGIDPVKVYPVVEIATGVWIQK